ncbi:MAG: M48 family metalloprotease, partial [Anaerolineae bacterium]
MTEEEVPHAQSVGSEDVSVDSDRQETAREYARISRRLMVVDLVVSFALVVGFLMTGASQWLRNLLVGWGLTSPWLLVPTYVLLVYLGYTAIFLPLSWYSGFVLPHRYEMSTQDADDWWLDQLKGMGLSLAIGLPLSEVIYWFLRAQPETWWIWAAVLLVVLSVVMGYLFPVLIVPIFYDLTVLEDEDLVQRIKGLAERVGVQVAGVYTIDLSRRTRAANAMVMGVGSTKRIALGDTLYEDFTGDEIETILAHELG